MYRLVQNLKSDCNITSLCVISSKVDFHLGDEVKLYDTIKDACSESDNFSLYKIADVVDLNTTINRPTGIICHACEDEKIVLSLIVQSRRPDLDDNRQNTRFCLANKIEIR